MVGGRNLEKMGSEELPRAMTDCDNDGCRTLPHNPPPFDPEPSTLNPQPSTLNFKPYTLHPTPYIRGGGARGIEGPRARLTPLLP